MSYRIAYKHVAIVFPHEVLNASLPEGKAHFYQPHYFLLELGGDNNLYRTDYLSGRERRVRSWCTLAYGMDWQVIQEVVRFSAACESGCLKLYGKGDITPECFIRRGRNSLAAAIPFDQALTQGYGLSARLGLTVEKPWNEALLELNCFLGEKYDEHQKQYWEFNLNKPDHAALFFKYSKSVDDRPWRISVAAAGEV